MFNVLFFTVEDIQDSFPLENDMLVDLYLEEHPEIIHDNGELLSYFEADNISYVVIPPLRLKLLGQYPCGFKFEGDVPASIRQDVQEAANCLAVGAVNASAVMCRRAIERLAKSLGIRVKPRQNLYGILIKLRDQGYVDEALFAAMKEIKDWGNVGAHADEEDELGFDKVRRVLELVRQVIGYVYSNQKARLEKSTRELSNLGK